MVMWTNRRRRQKPPLQLDLTLSSLTLSVSFEESECVLLMRIDLDKWSGGRRVAMADENGLDWFRAAIWVSQRVSSMTRVASKPDNHGVVDPSEVNDFGGWPWLVETESLGEKRNGGVGWQRHHLKPNDHCANLGFSSIFLLLGCLL
uniref:Uncharacterized protein n=1 Tax=Fagus sylvatica TaxID=28930 RepID=A0A2N9F089_FAGSY